MKTNVEKFQEEIEAQLGYELPNTIKLIAGTHTFECAFYCSTTLDIKVLRLDRWLWRDRDQTKPGSACYKFLEHYHDWHRRGDLDTDEFYEIKLPGNPPTDTELEALGVTPERLKQRFRIKQGQISSRIYKRAGLAGYQQRWHNNMFELVLSGPPRDRSNIFDCTK
jgi:hypothetical protein